MHCIRFRRASALALALLAAAMPAFAQSSGHDLADAPFTRGFLSKEDIAAAKDELIFQRATQAYLWMMPVINMYGMKEGSEKVFGKGYNVLPIFKDRLKTLPDRGFLVLIRLYGPTKAFFDKSWKPDDIVKIN